MASPCPRGLLQAERRSDTLRCGGEQGHWIPCEVALLGDEKNDKDQGR